MKQTDHDWSLYRSFLAVFRTGSLSAAARTLGATQPTVGRHIAALEKSLDGNALFTRSQSGLMPTDLALELVPHAESMAAAADALVRTASAQADDIAGTVRISASEIVGTELLAPILTEFRRLHPHVEIELGLSNRNADLLRRDADIAVRMVQPEQKALVARKVGTVTLGLFATRAYIEQFGAPRNLRELNSHTIIGFDQTPPPQRFMDDLAVKFVRENFSYRCDSDAGQLAAIRAGFGIGACQRGIARRDPNLIHVLPNEFQVPMDVWIAMHENLKKVQRMQLMFNHLFDRMGKLVAEDF